MKLYTFKDHMYNLFIDDQINEFDEKLNRCIRDPKIIDPSKVYVGVASVEEAIDYMEAHGCPIFISFDYDLGLDQLGKARETLEVVNWMIERDLNSPGFIPEGFSYQIHSKNVCSPNLHKLQSYLNQRKT